MKSSLQQKIAPAVQGMAQSFNAKKEALNPTKGTLNSGTDFKSLLLESNLQSKINRQDMESADLSKAKDYQDFLKRVNNKKSKEEMPKNKLSKDDFLKLFVTQLQQQDPLNPQDGAEMASQLAQFNSLEQMVNINTALAKLDSTVRGNQAVQDLNYLGKEATLDSGVIEIKDGVTHDVTTYLAAPAYQAKFELKSLDGTVVATQEVGQVDEGEQDLKLEFKSRDGVKVRDGVYQLSMEFSDKGGEAQQAVIRSRTTIDGVDLHSQRGKFRTSLGSIDPGEMSSIQVKPEIEPKPVDKVAPLAKSPEVVKGPPEAEISSPTLEQPISNFPPPEHVKESVEPKVAPELKSPLVSEPNPVSAPR